jgi:hypothetical protein
MFWLEGLKKNWRGGGVVRDVASVHPSMSQTAIKLMEMTQFGKRKARIRWNVNLGHGES